MESPALMKGSFVKRLSQSARIQLLRLGWRDSRGSNEYKHRQAIWWLNVPSNRGQHPWQHRTWRTWTQRSGGNRESRILANPLFHAQE